MPIISMINIRFEIVTILLKRLPRDKTRTYKEAWKNIKSYLIGPV